MSNHYDRAGYLRLIRTLTGVIIFWFINKWENTSLLKYSFSGWQNHSFLCGLWYNKGDYEKVSLVELDRSRFSP